MRGSPLFRTLLLVSGLLLAGWGMLRFAGASSRPPADSSHHAPEPPMDGHRYGFSLTLSAAAKSVDLKSRDGTSLFHGAPGDPLNGVIELNTVDPVVLISIAWKDADAPGHRFAKLTLEPPGKATLVHFFEATGDLDDVWELPTE